MIRNLAVFDVDGTLTDTADVDSACFAETLAREFGFEDVDPDWTSYSEFTDSMIIDEIFEERLGRRPDRSEISRLVDRFVAILKRAHDERPDDFAEIPGASALLATLRGAGSWAVAVATGGWERSARLKLGYAGIGVDGVPLASAEDSRRRAGIVEAAVSRAEAGAGGPFGRIVLVGDTLWDLRTAAELGLPFLGVGDTRRAATLLSAGAGAVVPGFEDAGTAIDLLARVGVPSSGASDGSA